MEPENGCFLTLGEVFRLWDLDPWAALIESRDLLLSKEVSAGVSVIMPISFRLYALVLSVTRE